MRAIIAFFALWSLMLTPGMAQEADLASAKSFVIALADDAINILSSEKTRAGRRQICGAARRARQYAPHCAVHRAWPQNFK